MAAQRKLVQDKMAGKGSSDAISARKETAAPVPAPETSGSGKKGLLGSIKVNAAWGLNTPLIKPFG